MCKQKINSIFSEQTEHAKDEVRVMQQGARLVNSAGRPPTRRFFSMQFRYSCYTGQSAFSVRFRVRLGHCM